MDEGLAACGRLAEQTPASHRDADVQGTVMDSMLTPRDAMPIEGVQQGEIYDCKSAYPQCKSAWRLTIKLSAGRAS